MNGETPQRQGNDFHQILSVDNSLQGKWTDVTVKAYEVAGGSPNRVKTETGRLYLPKTPQALTHDEAGNLISDGRWSYQWDAQNRLVAAHDGSVSPAVIYTFSYDSGSRRIWKKKAVSGAVQEFRRFYYDGWNLIAEADVNLATSAVTIAGTYTWGIDLSGSTTGAGGVGGLIFSGLKDQAGVWQTSVPLYDGSGNVSALANATTGGDLGKFGYGPFGEMTSRLGSAKSFPFRWSAKYYENDLELTYYGYRYFHNRLGRWVSKDPAEEAGGVNLYGFVANSPVGSFDVLGLWRKKGNHLYAAEQGDTLDALATMLKGSSKDWSCLWPVKTADNGAGYPRVSPCDVYDASNLATPAPGATSVRLSLEREFFEVDRRIFPGTILMNGGGVARFVRKSSKEGATPISEFLVGSHTRGPGELGGKTGPWIFARSGYFRLTDLTAMNKAPTYKRAESKKGPLRCWFTRDNKSRFTACSSQTFASAFASSVIRRGAEALGTKADVGVGFQDGNPWIWWNPIYGQNGPTNHYGNNSEFFSVSVWRTFKGQL